MVSEGSVRESVVGVVLSDDNVSGKCSTEYKNILGVVILPNMSETNAEELRRIMCVQLACLPPTFTLLTKEGWPVQKRQEHIVKASHIISSDLVITIRRQFENPRVGVTTTSGDYLGFVFIQHHWSLYQVREAIDEQLKDINNRTKREYIFVERNGWPVAKFQEHLLTVLDILLNQHICIQHEKKNWSDPPLHLRQHHNRPICLPALPSPSSHSVHETQDVPDGKPKTGFQLSFRKNKSQDGKNTIKCKDLVAKPILISYVRAEAAQYALDLKEELCSLGFSVYLDVHEIKTGSDWQDALNYAVSNCHVFVPIITATYGKSRWTNREVKLADVLGKYIIPISFLDHWPPECLAIQFASTQYISSRPPDGDHVKTETIIEKCTDPRVWPRTYVKRVSKEVAERCKQALIHTKSEPPYNPPSPEPMPRGVGKKQLIVISAHPKQKLMCHELRTEFEQQGYEVWCSIDILDVQDQVFGDSVDFCPSESKTPRDLPPIPEGESVFSQVYSEIANSIEESKRSASLSKADYEGIHEKKQLTRLASMASDISQLSSLTTEKMEQLQKFQQKADQAGVVVIIVSEAYTKSKTSQQQVFYCEHRKHVVLVKYDQVAVPSWFSMLMGNDMITNISNPQFMTTLRTRVKRALNPASSTAPKGATAEAKMQYYVNFVNKSLPELDKCVFIAGSSKLASTRSEEICKAIGKELAKIENVRLITGGCFGAQEIVARSFYEARENNKEPGFSTAESSVIHILPTKDTQDYTAKLRQNPDGTFETVPFGKSIFLGDSVREREDAVARLFNTCVVIEGGTGAAHEVEEFIWNDHFVIPIISTGGAAGGHYGVPIKILEAPPCVSGTDWNILTEKEAAPEEVGNAVLNIVVSLKKSIATHSKPLPEPRRIKRKSRKSKQIRQRQEVNNTTQNKVPLSAINNIQSTHAEEINDVTKGEKSTKWQKFLHIISATKTHSC